MLIGLTHLHTYLLIMLRLSGMLLAARVFGENLLSWSIKIPLLLILSLLLAQVSPAITFPLPGGLVLAAAAELLLGLAVGLVTSVLFYALSTAGQLAAIQIGLGFGNLVDPHHGETASMLARFLWMTGWMVVLGLDGHQQLLRAVGESFRQLPPGTALAALGRTALEIPLAGARILLVALLVAAPVLGTVLLVNVGLALLDRAAPQLHVLAVGFIITIAVGLLALVASIGSVGEIVQRSWLEAIDSALALCRSN